jgi:hypothetical protein
MQPFDVCFVRNGRTIIDWERRMIVMRKPSDTLHVSLRPALRFAHYKRDGMRVVCANGCIFTTRGHDIAEQLPDNIRTSYYGTIVDAELYVPGQGREAVKTALASDPSTLRLSVFATTAVHYLLELPQWCYEHGLECETFLDIREQRLLNSTTHDGFVLKSHSMYGHWLKEKPRMTVDLVVTGVRPGKGQHTGRIGALECADATGRFVCAAGAMDIPMRIALTEMAKNGTLIGRVVEIAYERVGSRGGLQHPRFIALRDDKEVQHASIIPE